MTQPFSNASETHEMETAAIAERHLHLAPDMPKESQTDRPDAARVPELGVPQLTFIKSVIGGEEADQVHQMDSDRLYSVATGIYRVFRQVQESGRPSTNPQAAEKHAARLKLFLIEGSSYSEIAESEEGGEYKKVQASLGNVALRLARNLPEETKQALVQEPELAEYTPPEKTKRKQAAAPKTRTDGSEVIANPDNEWQTATMKRMFTHKLLKPAEEIALAKRIERGDLDAKQRMIEQNIRLISKPAKALRHIAPQFSETDIIQEGTLGLIRAAEKFDWRKGYRFSTYATLWIRQAIQRGVDNSGYTIRVPVHWQQKNRKMMGAERAMEKEIHELGLMSLETEEAYLEIENRTGIPIEDIKEIKRLTAHIVSLDMPIGEDGDTSYGSQVASEFDVLSEVSKSDYAEKIHDYLDVLSERDAKIVKLTYGMDGYNQSGPTAVARELGITTETVNRTLGRVHNALRSRLDESIDSVV